MRKLLIVFAVVAGLFGLQGSLVMPMPQEKARIEVVLKTNAEVSIVGKQHVKKVCKIFVQETLQKAQVVSPHILTLLISSIYFQSYL